MEEADSSPFKFQLESLRDNDQKRIAPIVVKATRMAINSSKPRAVLWDDSGSEGGLFVIVITLVAVKFVSKQIKPQMTLLHHPFLIRNTRLRREASYVIRNS